MAREITAFRRDFGGLAGSGYVIYPRPVILPLDGGTLAYPRRALKESSLNANRALKG